MDKNYERLTSKRQDSVVSAKHGSDKLAKKDTVSYIAIAVATVLCIVSMWMFFKHSMYSLDSIIEQDVKQLQEIFKRIDKDCKIIRFAHEKNYIDFLTVKEFVGEQVGAMTVAYPKRWNGPYLHHNPTVDNIHYVVVRTKEGYYIAPGDGVMTSNGKMIGQDIILNSQTDIEALLQRSDNLKSSTGVFVAKLELVSNNVMHEMEKPLNYLHFD